MNRPVSNYAALTTVQLASKGENRSFALWPLILVAVVMIVVALTSDASLTPTQRMEVYLQSGMFP